MVDSINPAGQGQSITNARKAQEPQKVEDSKDKKDSAPVDQVTISEEALNRNQAEEAAKKVSSALSENGQATLSVDQTRLSTLV